MSAISSTSTAHSLPAGTTEAQVFTLMADGSAIDLTGLTLGIEVYDISGTVVADPGTTSVVDAESGQVQLIPDADAFTVQGSPYSVRWTVTDGSSTFKVPNGPIPDKWLVTR